MRVTPGLWARAGRTGVVCSMSCVAGWRIYNFDTAGVGALTGSTEASAFNNGVTRSPWQKRTAIS